MHRFLSVCLSKVAWFRAKGHVGQGQPKAHDFGRWAHINVKLLHTRLHGIYESSVVSTCILVTHFK